MRIRRNERTIYTSRDAETLLDLVFYTLDTEGRHSLMAEAPGAYRRWCQHRYRYTPDVDVIVRDEEDDE
jgi:hypothetical protein